jgi:hypothetical protein
LFTRNVCWYLLVLLHFCFEVVHFVELLK